MGVRLPRRPACLPSCLPTLLLVFDFNKDTKDDIRQLVVTWMQNNVGYRPETNALVYAGVLCQWDKEEGPDGGLQVLKVLSRTMP